VVPVWCRQVQGAERLQIGEAVGLGDQHHAILIGLVENGGNDALAECIVERVVDGRRGDCHTAPPIVD